MGEYYGANSGSYLKNGRRRLNFSTILMSAPIFLAAVWMFLIALYLAPRSSCFLSMPDVSSRVVLHQLPLLRGVEYHAFDGPGGKYSLAAEKISVRERRYGEVVFTSFKDLVISRARIVVNDHATADCFDWANSDDFLFLVAAVLPFSKDDNDEISIFGMRLVIEGLEIYRAANDGISPTLLLSADEMTKESMPDEINLTGRIQFIPNPGEKITCSRSATWIASKKMMYFPDGCLVNGKPAKENFWAQSGNRRDTLKRSKANDAVAPVIQYAKPQLPRERLGRQQVKMLIKKKGKEAVQNLLVQYLILNPKAFRVEGILPMLIMGPEFKPGQFTPGPLAGNDLH